VRYVQVSPGKSGGPMQTLHNEWLSVRGKTIGPEVQFGWIMGELMAEPVLILKSCAGNRSLGWDLLPPGSERFVEGGMTHAGYKDTPDKWTEGQPKKQVNWYGGKQYDDDMANARAVLDDLGKYYPGAEKYEISGFVWWQGFKDQNPVLAGRYELNLVNLIKALRKDYNAPNARFVLATIGYDGWQLSGPGLIVAKAQLAMNDAEKYPGFAGNVKCVDSRPFWRDASESPVNQRNFNNHNAAMYMEVGNALGWAMAELLNKASP